MKVKLTQGVSINGVSHLPGAIADLNDFDANYLIGGGRAEKYVEPPKPKEHERKVEVVADVPKQVPAVQDTAKKSKNTEK